MKGSGEMMLGSAYSSGARLTRTAGAVILTLAAVAGAEVLTGCGSGSSGPLKTVLENDNPNTDRVQVTYFDGSREYYKNGTHVNVLCLHRTDGARATLESSGVPIDVATEDLQPVTAPGSHMNQILMLRTCAAG